MIPVSGICPKLDSKNNTFAIKTLISKLLYGNMKFSAVDCKVGRKTSCQECGNG